VILNQDTKVEEVGKVEIVRGTKQTTTSLNQRSYHLHPSGKISFHPQLLIGSKETIANHGSVSGGIDEDQLRYLMSRGLTNSEATQTIIISHIQPLLEALDPDQKVICWEKINGYFHR
jgi:Fe-S cluster assembly protein SufD